MKTACKKMITQQVSEILRIEIEDGDLYPGTKIPTDTELAAILRYLDTILKDGFIFLSNIVCVKPSNFSMFRSILCPKTYTSLSEIYFSNPSLTKTSMAVLTICF